MKVVQMIVYGIKKDYMEGWILMHFDGEYNEEEALEVARNSYPNIKSVENVEQPYDSKVGYRQLGSILFSE
jgi:hypothetical protein